MIVYNQSQEGIYLFLSAGSWIGADGLNLFHLWYASDPVAEVTGATLSSIL